MSRKLWAPLAIIGVAFGACTADPPSTDLTSSAASSSGSGAGGGAATGSGGGGGGDQGTGGLGEAPTCTGCKALFCEDQRDACDSNPECAALLACRQGKCWLEWPSCHDAHPGGVAPVEDLSRCLDDFCDHPCLSGDPCFQQAQSCENNPECMAIWDCMATTCPTECPPDDSSCALACWQSCQEAHPNGKADWQAGVDCLNAQCM
jgi:hypothetical protein